MRITGPLLAALLGLTGTAVAAPGDPWVAYVANSTASRAVVMRIDPSTGGLVEIARNGPGGNLFDHPYDLAVAADGSLLVADMGVYATGGKRDADGAIIRVDPATGEQSLVSKGGRLVDPAGLTVAPDGGIYVVENVGVNGEPEVLRIDPASGAQSVITTGGELCYPFGIARESDGSLLVADFGSIGGDDPVTCPQNLGQVVRVDASTGAQAPLARGGFVRNPFGIAVAANGRALVVNQTGAAAAVMSVNPVTGAQGIVAPNGPEDVLEVPQRLSLTPDGDPVVSDFALSDDEGGLVRVGLADGAQALLRQGDLFNNPLGVAVVANRPPMAALTATPAAVAGGGEVRFDASGSSDPETLRLRYTWDLDGNGTFERSSDAPVATERYSGTTTLTARVRVSDPHGASAVAAAPVAVDSIRPVITGFRVVARATATGSARERRTVRRTTFAYRLSEASAVSIAVRRPVRVRTSRCRRHPQRRRCLRWRTVTTLHQAGVRGPNTLGVSGRARRRLRPGAYRATALAVDAVGNRSRARVIRLRVAASRPKRN